MSGSNRFLEFAKPFLDALKETFEMMVQVPIKPHSPEIKQSAVAKGDITAMIGMNGVVEKDGTQKPFKGLLALSFPEEVYLKVASSMLMEEYTEYNDEISDTGSEIVNIIMGNAKKGLTPLGFKLEMASPSTVRGKQHEIKYPPQTTVIAITVGSELGDFSLELCYQEV
jgi:chemotaxis protein CheX